MKYKLQEKLEKNKQAYGTFMEINDSIVVEALAVAGFDYLLVDFEHSSMSSEALKPIIQTAEARGISTLVRVKAPSRPDILRPLDLGAQGLIVPNIKTMDEIHDLVTWAKYRPLGERGFFTNRVIDFGFSDDLKDLEKLFKEQNKRTLLIPQCETIESLKIIEEIVATDGIDGIFIGPFDLSIALGIPTEFDNPIFEEAVERIYKTCRAHNKLTFIFANDLVYAKKYKDYGFDALTFGMDMSMLINGSISALAELKND